MKLLHLAIVLLIALETQAATYNCADLQLSTVQSNVNLCVDGDTVILPAGTNHWFSTLTNNSQNIVFKGASPLVSCAADISNPNLRPTNFLNTVATVIYNEVTNAPLINFSTSSNQFPMTIYGFTLWGSSSNVPGNSVTPCIEISGSSWLTRVHDVHFWMVGETCIQFNGWVEGVVDHCVFWRNNYFGVQVNHQTWGGWATGDGSFAATNSLGTTNAIYIESCTATNNRVSPGFIDSENGGRFVLRYNAITNDNFGWHGTESGQRNRGARQFECYQNTLFFDTNANTTWFTAVFVRSGTGVIYSNYFFGYDELAQLAAYRETPNTWVPWGNVDGTNIWDVNSGGVVASGTHTGSNGAGTLTDGTKSWTVNQWLGGYMIENTTSGKASAISANTSTTVTYQGSIFSGNLTFNTGDGYQIALVTAALDQPGRGQSDLVTNFTTPVNATLGGTAVNPRQALDPIYEWNNNDVRSPLLNPFYPYIIANQPTIITNRDFVDGVVRPGYSALVFPHPLVQTPDPNITVQPQNQTVAVGSAAAFSVTVTTASPPLTYQWQKNGANISGATQSSYTTPATTCPDNGAIFNVIVTNSTNGTASASASLTVTGCGTVNNSVNGINANVGSFKSAY